METVGSRLKKAIKELGISMESFGAPLEVSRSSISGWTADKTEIPKTSAIAIETVHGISSRWLLTGESPMWVEHIRPKAPNTVEIPIIEGMPSCGPGGEVQDPGSEAEHYPFRASFAKEVLRQCGAGTISNLFLAQVAGESMRPTILPGDLVLINNQLDLRTNPKQSSLYLVRRSPNSGEARVKRVFFTAGSSDLTLQSDNPAFRPISVPIEGMRLQDLILGKVCWYGRYLQEVLPPQQDW
jgi:phage repressor protein C with HTH and peptisase S24 domain